jgi:NCS1 family nucleobase:cation symporter-1
MNAMRKLSAWAAPLLAVSFVALAIWAIRAMGGLAPVFEIQSQFQTTGDFLKVFFPSMTGVVAFWATLALNIPDFCRYATSQKSQAIAQTIALPLTMAVLPAKKISAKELIWLGLVVSDMPLIAASFSNCI